MLSGHLRGGILTAALRDTMAVTGALFALFVAATTFTLVFRAFGSDRLLAALIAGMPGSGRPTAVLVLVLLGLCAFVLDAFEIILVIIPVVMPPVLIQMPDAVWMAVLTLLVLQTSFLIPPFGYAVMMVRSRLGERVPLPTLASAIAPFLCAQLLVLTITIALPGLTHLVASATSGPEAAPALSPDEVRRRLESIGQ